MKVDAIVQIERAELTDKQYRAARRLLDNADDGHAKLTKAAALELTNTASEGAMRRILGQLQCHELLHYSINGYVYIDFMAWSATNEDDLICPESDHWGTRWTRPAQHLPLDFDEESARPRALSDHPRALSDHPRALSDHPRAAEGDHPRALSDHPRAKSDHPRAKSDHPRALFDSTYTHAGAGVGWLVGSTILPTNEDQPTNQPTITEQALSVALLLAAGIMPRNAKRLAALVPLERVRQAVGHWWDNRDDQFRSAGIIVTWLDDWESAGIPAISDAFRRSDLHRASLTAEELSIEQADTAEIAETSVAMPAEVGALAVEEVTPLGALWGKILHNFALSAPEIFDAWLRDTQLVSIDEATATIAAPATKVERVARLDRRLCRELAMSGQRVERIVVREVGNGP